MSNRTKAPVIVRSIVLEDANITLSVDDRFWRELEDLAKENDLTVAELVELVESALGAKSNLSSALQAYVEARRVMH